jgi:hypothetical protein
MGLFSGILTLALIGSGVPAHSGELAVDQKLEFAFGKGCKELSRPLRLWLPERRLIMAADEFLVESDGRIRLSQCSLALFPSKEGERDEKSRALTTLRSDSVYLALDRTIANFADLATNRKITIIAIEVSGGPKLSVGNR